MPNRRQLREAKLAIILKKENEEVPFVFVIKHKHGLFHPMEQAVRVIESKLTMHLFYADEECLFAVFDLEHVFGSWLGAPRVDTAEPHLPTDVQNGVGTRLEVA